MGFLLESSEVLPLPTVNVPLKSEISFRGLSQLPGIIQVLVTLVLGTAGVGPVVGPVVDQAIS